MRRHPCGRIDRNSLGLNGATMKQRKTMLFNNCKGRDHADAFSRADAFYDLNTFGRQATQATDLKVGQVCVVAQSATDADQITFEQTAVVTIQM